MSNQDGKRPQQALPTDAPHNMGLLHELDVAIKNHKAKRVIRKPAGAPEAPGTRGRLQHGIGSSQQEALRAVRPGKPRVENTSDDDKLSAAEAGGRYSRRTGGVGS